MGTACFVRRILSLLTLVVCFFAISSSADPNHFFQGINPRRWEKSDNGRIYVRWAGSVPAPLKEQISEVELDKIIRQSFGLWASVSEGTLPSTYGGSIGRVIEDIHGLA